MLSSVIGKRLSLHTGAQMVVITMSKAGMNVETSKKDKRPVAAMCCLSSQSPILVVSLIERYHLIGMTTNDSQ